MRIFRFSRALLGDLLVPALCALIALSGVAQARAHGGKVFAAETSGHFTLCTQTNAAGGDEPAPDHDCSDCCLPRLVAILDHRPALPLHFLQQAAAEPEIAARVSDRGATHLPWSRGPPTTA